MRILGIDYGDKNIGVAISCPSLKIALGVETIRRHSPENFKAPILRLREIMREHNVSKLVLGFPKNMDGSIGERCERTLEFKQRLHRNFKSLEIVLWDERLSSLSQERVMAELGLSRDRIKKSLDEAAAIYILQGYLDSINRKEDCVLDNFDDVEEFDDLDDEDIVITLTDENGAEYEYLVVDALTHKGIDYMLIIPADTDEDSDDFEADILKKVGETGDDAMYATIEDENEYNEVAALFMENDDYEIEV